MITPKWAFASCLGRIQYTKRHYDRVHMYYSCFENMSGYKDKCHIPYFLFLLWKFDFPLIGLSYICDCFVCKSVLFMTIS